MKISIDNKTNDKLIWVTVSCSNLEEIKLREEFYRTVLLQLLDGSSINLITIEPQDYSLAYDIPSYRLRKIKGKNFLVNSIPKCDVELIEKIVSSEEFERTLLLIVKEQPLLSDDNLINILDLIKGKFITKINGVIYCEDDGDSLCLYNTTVDLEELISISKTLTDDVVTETI